MKKLRLLVTEKCNRNCPGCCNKDWDLDALSVEDDFTQYEEIYLTGGEPMLFPDLIGEIASDIYGDNPRAKIFLYTAMTGDVLLPYIYFLDGVTITLHTQGDVYPFSLMASKIPDFLFNLRSLRVNIFKGVEIDSHLLVGWQVKDGIEWIKDCPLPENEVFKRYEELK